MRSITSASVNGPEGIKISLLMWWMDVEFPKIDSARILDSITDEQFSSVRDDQVGELLQQSYDFWGAFAVAVDRDPFARYCKSIIGNDWPRMRERLLVQVAKTVKASQAFTDRLPRIKSSMRRLRAVIEVHAA